MALSREIISTIKERADIVEVIGERVHLVPSGADFLGLCPFHGEKTPSFRVSPAYRTYHCFGCGVGGSVVDFVMTSENLEFPEAITSLAERYGVPLEGGEGGGRSHARPQEALAAAQAWFSELLHDSPEAEAARVYMRGRGFDEADWKAFHLGFARDDWQGFLQYGQDKGFPLEDLLASGLVRTSQNGRNFDMLRKRVVFPIANERGNPIGFGGRVIDPLDSPKYLNIPETKLYRKSRVLFGLAQGLADLRASRRAILVEGYLDVMRMHQHGFREALATCGTALTPEHIQVLERNADRAVLLFDGDDAGIKAALRSAPLFLNSGMEARVVLLPDGQDPDDFLSREGADAFRSLLDQAESLLEFLVFQLQSRNGNSLQGREQTLGELAPIIGQIRKAVPRDLTVRYLADLVGVRPEAVLSMVEKPKAHSRPQGAPVGKSGAPDSSSTLPSTEAAVIPMGRESRHQRRVLRLLLEHRELAAQAQGMVQPSEFTEPALRRLLETLFGFTHEEFSQVTVEELLDWYPDQAGVLRAVLTDEALHMGTVSEPGRELENSVYDLKDERKALLFQKLKHLAGTPEEEPAFADYSTLARQLAVMKQALRTTHTPRPGLVLREKEG